jgi:hypothetical protein
MTMLSTFWRAVRELNPDAQGEQARVGVRDGEIAELLDRAGLEDVQAGTLVSGAHYEDFDDFWQPFTFAVGPAGSYLREQARGAAGRDPRAVPRRARRPLRPVRARGARLVRARHGPRLVRRGQLPRRLVEHLGVAVDVGLGGGGRHQRHVVERRQQDPAVERVEVDQPVQRLVAGGRRLRAGARALGVEEVLDAAAEPGDVPGSE